MRDKAMNTLSYDERDVLKTILAVQGPNLERHLETWGLWLRDIERARIGYNVQPALPLVLLSVMGIYGRAVKA